MVTHELRSPVGATQSLVRTFAWTGRRVNEKQIELLKRVEIRLNDLLALINDLLTLAASKSISAEKPLQAVKIHGVIQHLVEYFCTGDGELANYSELLPSQFGPYSSSH